MRRSVGAVAATVLVVCLIAGCGGGGPAKVSAVAYAGSLCRALVPFEQDIYTHQSELSGSNAGSPAAGKAAIVRFVANLERDIGSAQSRLRAAGVPDVSGGQKLADAIVGLFGRIGDAMKDAKTQALAIPTTSLAGFQSGAEKLATSVRTSVSSLGGDLGGVNRGAIEKAAQQAPACHSLS